MTVATAAGYTHSAVVSTVQAALQSFISTLPRDPVSQTVTLPYSRLSQVAYDASPGVTNVTGITLNSGTSDLVGTSQQVIRAGTLTVT
jgi:hypothetical protein